MSRSALRQMAGDVGDQDSADTQRHVLIGIISRPAFDPVPARDMRHDRMSGVALSRPGRGDIRQLPDGWKWRRIWRA
jgi:hypothetical protein